jgi:hypothetical protein
VHELLLRMPARPQTGTNRQICARASDERNDAKDLNDVDVNVTACIERPRMLLLV